MDLGRHKRPSNDGEDVEMRSQSRCRQCEAVEEAGVQLCSGKFPLFWELPKKATTLKAATTALRGPNTKSRRAHANRWKTPEGRGKQSTASDGLPPQQEAK